MDWEYYTYKVKTSGFWGSKLDTGNLDNALNEIGRQGWELVSAVGLNATYGITKEVVMIFKRQR